MIADRRDIVRESTAAFRVRVTARELVRSPKLSRESFAKKSVSVAIRGESATRPSVSEAWSGTGFSPSFLPFSRSNLSIEVLFFVVYLYLPI